MKKRGIVEVQFNWIFILIIGALIILFFVKVIYNQKVIADTKLANSVLSDLTLLSTGAEVATSTASSINLAGNAIGFDCEECECRYFVEDIGGDQFRSYNGRSLYAPSLVKGTEILTWALDWNMPFKITNFLFITSPEIRYVFVHEDRATPPNFLIDKIVNKLPEQINRGLVGNDVYDILDIGNFDYRGEYKVRFIVYDVDLPNFDIEIENVINDQLKNLHYSHISVLNITPMGLATGELEFYKVNPQRELEIDNDITYYLGETSLIGAILVDNYFNYVCPMETSFRRLNYAAKIYKGRVDSLEEYFTSPGVQDPGLSCQITYGNTDSSFITLIGESETYFRSISSYDNIKNVHDAAFSTNALEDQNDKALLFSCPEIF